MLKPLSLLLVGLSLLAVPASAADRVDPETRLARMLEGRVAGEPVDCVNLSRIRSSRIIDDTAIVFDAGGTIYVNRPRGGRDALDSWSVLVTRSLGGRLCSIDTVDLVDGSTHHYRSTVFLGEFVPYRRAR